VARSLVFLLLLFLPAISARAETPIPAAPTEWVTDNASLLSTQAVESNNARLQNYERETGHQIIVYVTPTTGGVPVEDWTVRAFARWKVGRKGLDDGLALFIFPKDRTVRIEVGYGLEPKVPDVLASRIIRETIAPELQAGHPDAAVTDGVDRILKLVGGESASSPAAGGSDEGQPISLTPVQLVLIGIGLIVLLLIAIRSPWLAFYLLVNIVGGGGGGFSGGGGGFSGGGGRSGGGGASGRW
jgi:uncharacterized protein